MSSIRHIKDNLPPKMDAWQKRKAAEAIARIYEKATVNSYYTATQLWHMADIKFDKVPPRYLRDSIAYALPLLGWRRVYRNEGFTYYHYPLDANRMEATDWQRLPAPHQP